MNPATMAAIASILGSLYQAYQSNQGGEMKSSYSPEQIGLLNQSIAGAGGNGPPDITQNPQYQQGNEYLMSLFNDPEFFNAFEAPMQREFQEKTMPTLANRYASMGTGGAFQGSGFRNQALREGANLQEKIAAMRGNMQMNAIPQLMNSSQMPFNNYNQLLNTALGNRQNDIYQPPNNAMGNLSGPLLQYALQSYGNQGTQPSQPSQASLGMMPGTHPSTQ